MARGIRNVGFNIIINEHHASAACPSLSNAITLAMLARATESAGGFEPLRFLPKGNKRVVLGLVTSKFGELEDRDAIKRRIDEAACYADVEQFCLSPQCGFASTEEGNILSEGEQWQKLEMIVELAGEVWNG